MSETTKPRPKTGKELINDIDKKWRTEGFDYDDMMSRFALMLLLGIEPWTPRPIPEVDEGWGDEWGYVYQHIDYDIDHKWPLSGGSTLYWDEYNAMKKLLETMAVARTCHCGNPIPCGRGRMTDGTPAGPDNAGFFCTGECYDKHRAQRADMDAIAKEHGIYP